MDILEEKKPKKSIHSPFVKRVQSLKISREEAKQTKDAPQNEPKGVVKPLGLWTVKRQEARKAAKKPEKPKATIVLAFYKDKADSDSLHDQLERQIIALGIRKKPAKAAKWRIRRRAGKSGAKTRKPSGERRTTRKKPSRRRGLKR